LRKREGFSYRKEKGFGCLKTERKINHRFSIVKCLVFGERSQKYEVQSKR